MLIDFENWLISGVSEKGGKEMLSYIVDVHKLWIRV